MLNSAIVAHDIGIGKTIMSLLITLRLKIEDRRDHPNIGLPRMYGPTLVICPPGLLRSWHVELDCLFRGQFRVICFYSTDVGVLNKTHVTKFDAL